MPLAFDAFLREIFITMKIATRTICILALATIAQAQAQVSFDPQVVSMTDAIKKTHPTAAGPLIPSQNLEILKRELEVKTAPKQTNSPSLTVTTNKSQGTSPKMVKEGDRWVLKTQP